MPRIFEPQTVLPEHVVTAADLPAIGSSWLSDDSEAQEKYLRIAQRSGVRTRRFILPYEEILQLQGLQYRAEQFEKFGTAMLVEAIEKAIATHQLEPEDIGALVFSSCSVPTIPAIDAAAILRSSLSSRISRVPIYQHGCAGGVIGMGLGAKLASLGKPVIVASVELCSMVFQPENHCGAHLVGAGIFADGAAATVLTPEEVGPLVLKASQSYLIPESRHLMGYDIFDDGFHLRLDRKLPQVLVEECPNAILEFLSRDRLAANDINYWLFHPGGIKILEFLRETLEISQESCHWAYDVLREHGNLSSATIHYVLKAFMQDAVIKPGERA
ncbi:MAG: hypothetical protein KDD62_03010, partial [Bdellovibrionales bacterium]|nr:hypothetical protein [Bdellovibrionales bacterium]